MEADLKWVIGLGVSFTLATFTVLVAAFRNISGKMSSGHAELHKKIDRVKENYVRRDDLDNHLKRVDDGLRDLRTQVSDSHDKIMAELSKRK